MFNTQQKAMALDVGDARIGIAMSDPMRLFAHPQETIANRGRETFEQVLEFAEKNNIGTIIVGMPYELDGTVGSQAQKAQRFYDKLLKRLNEHPNLKGTEMVLWDERYSTAEAKRALVGSKLKNSERRAAQDRIAAAIMLDGYLQSAAKQ